MIVRDQREQIGVAPADCSKANRLWPGSTHERGLPWFSSCRYNWFCPVLAALIQNIIFLAAHYFTVLVPIAQQPGQAVVLGRLSRCLCVGTGDHNKLVWLAECSPRIGQPGSMPPSHWSIFRLVTSCWCGTTSTSLVWPDAALSLVQTTSGSGRVSLQWTTCTRRFGVC
jgi:hypothetical protein